MFERMQANQPKRSSALTQAVISNCVTEKDVGAMATRWTYIINSNLKEDHTEFSNGHKKHFALFVLVLVKFKIS